MYKDMNFSLWCDFLERDFINGEFEKLIKNGTINGATSNPSIFKAAILSSKAYELSKKALKKKSAKKIYEALAIGDMKLAANKLLKNYATNDDGFVSLEVDPNYANDAVATYKEAKRLYKSVNFPNLMIKIPASKKGIAVMQKLVAKGININATLVFSTTQVKDCLKAFKQGTTKFKKRFPDFEPPKCVISVFVSRFDRMLDESLKKSNLMTAKFGINNALMAYILVKQSNLSNVRVLFASTGVKDKSLEADYYIKELLLPNSINTAPLDTIKSFIKDKNVAQIKLPTMANLNKFFKDTKEAGIDYDKVCQILFEDGLKQFKIAFKEILDGLR